MSNAASIVANDQFCWLRGTELISSWKSETGFRSDFCSSCGAPVPNPLRDMPYFWIPAGLLETGGKMEIVAHLCLAACRTLGIVAKIKLGESRFYRFCRAIAGSIAQKSGEI